MKARMKIVAQHCDRTTEEIYATPITLTVPGYSKPIMAAVDKRGFMVVCYGPRSGRIHY